MSALPKSKERRKYRRISDAVALQIRGLDEAANEQMSEAADLPDHPTHVVSLSPSGLRCYHDQAFTDGDILHLSVRLFPSGQTIDTDVRVVNAGEEGKPNANNRYFAGLSFTNLSGENKKLLLEHIRNIARESFGGAVKLVNG